MHGGRRRSHPIEGAPEPAVSADDPLGPDVGESAASSVARTVGDVTERKPPGVSFETWVEHQISLAQDRGDFVALPGAGRPLRNLDRAETAYDWALAKARREGVATADMLPPGLRLRRERDELPERAARLASESEVRALARDYNARAEEFWRRPQESRWSPLPGLADEEALVAGWLAARPPPPPEPPAAPRAGSAPRRRFGRLGRRRGQAGDAGRTSPDS